MPTLRKEWLTPGIALVAVLLVGALAYQNQLLMADLGDLQYRSVRPQAGEFVPPFLARTLDGDSLQIVSGVRSDRQVLVLFTTTCQYCAASVPTWNQLAQRLELDGTSLVGISLDSVPETESYRRTHGLQYPVITFPLESLRRMYRAHSVPITMVVAGDGRIIYSRMGVLSDGPAADSVIAAVHWRPAE